MKLENTFTWVDYTIFAVSLLASLAIGIYTTLSGKKKKTTKDFYFGDQKLNYFAVALSTSATYLSAIGILGIPGEVYTFGFSYAYNAIYKLFMHLICLFIIIPFFYNLQLPSVYEYFEHRFHRSLRLLACSLFILNMMSYMAVVLYAPALSLSQVSGLPIWSAILISGLVCTIYTALGGIKAVIWTDAFQMIIMAVGNISVFVFGIISAGGMYQTWKANYDEGRLGISLDADPTVRHTLWSVVIGGFFTGGLPYVVNQSLVQRFLSVKSKRTAQKMYSINIPVVWTWEWILMIMGLVMFAFYKNCDPMMAGRIQRPDQMMAIFVQDTLSSFTGFPGLFLSVVYSATLSTVSSGVNSVVMVLNEDFILPVMRKGKSRDDSSVLLSKILSFFVGFLAIGMAFGASAMGKRLMQLCLTITGLCSGPIVGLYVCGTLIRFCNTKGAVVGVLTGIVLSFWIGLGAFAANLPQKTFPVNADSCDVDTIFNMTGLLYNSTGVRHFPSPDVKNIIRNCTQPQYSLDCIGSPDNAPLSGLHVLYSISYQYYGFIGTFTTIIVAVLISCFTGGNHTRKIPEKFFLSSVFRLSKEASQEMEKVTEHGEYRSVAGDLEVELEVSVNQNKPTGKA